MILTKKSEGEVFIPPQMKQRDFTMKVTPEAFSATIDSLYADTIYSPVREYMANAYDAHRSVGSTKSIQVHAPTILENYFEVRDFGPGLTEEEIEEYYIKLFSSKKQNTNNEVGFFGLGCKAALTYTNQMVVTSYQNGFFRQYNIIRQGREIPVMLDGLSGETDEPDGLSVRYNTERDDLQLIQNAVRKAAIGFLGLEVGVETNIAAADIEVLVDNDEAFLIKFNGNHGLFDGYSLVQMGPILYPLAQRVFSSGGNQFVLIKKVKVGDLEPSTSRESLVLTTTQREQLTEYVRQAYPTLFDEYIERIDNDPSLTFSEKFHSIASVSANASLKNRNKYHGQLCYQNDEFVSDLLREFEGVEFNVSFQEAANRAFSTTEFDEKPNPIASIWLGKAKSQFDDYFWYDPNSGNTGGLKVYYTILPNKDAPPRGLYANAKRLGFNPHKDYHILVESQSMVDKIADISSSSNAYIEVPAVMQKAAKASTIKKLNGYRSLVGASARTDYSPTDSFDFESLTIDVEDLHWVPWSRSFGYYMGSNTQVQGGDAFALINVLGIDIKHVVACRKNDAEAAGLPMSNNIYDKARKLPAEQLVDMLVKHGMDNRLAHFGLGEFIQRLLQPMDAPQLKEVLLSANTPPQMVPLAWMLWKSKRDYNNS